MTFSYTDLIESSFKTTWRQKWLWLLGLFITEASIFATTDFNDLNESYNQVLHSEFWDRLNAIPGATVPVFMWIILFVILIVALSLVSIISKAGVIYGVSDDQKKVTVTFKEKFKQGMKKFLPMLWLELVFVAPSILLAVMFFLGARNDLSFLTGLVIVVFAIYNIFIFLFRHYCYCYITLKNMSFGSALKSGFWLFTKFPKITILVNLLRVLLGIVFLFVMILAASLAALPFILIAFLFTLTFSISIVAVVALFGILAAVVMAAVVKGFKSAFFYAMMTQTFMKIEK